MITGATAGIGKATAISFGKDGDRLILTGRRADRLDKISGEIRERSGVEVITRCFDIRDRQAVNQALDTLPEDWRKIDILVNNAGLASGLDPVDEADTDDWDRMIDTNVKGLLYVSRKVIPWMMARKTGHIINIGSIAGKEVYPRGNVYCATKYAVEALTRGMRIDLLPYGIRVSQVSPGATETEFSLVRFKGDREKASRVYQGYEPLMAEDIAGVIMYIASLPPRVNVHDIVVMPAAQASTMIYSKKS